MMSEYAEDDRYFKLCKFNDNQEAEDGQAAGDDTSERHQNPD